MEKVGWGSGVRVRIESRQPKTTARKVKIKSRQLFADSARITHLEVA